jgi:16S rRNA (cytidine1402-2'-O)-methyltransferase
MARRRNATRKQTIRSSTGSKPSSRPDSRADLQPSEDARASKPGGGLYVVATPIGNARDITLRALDTLTSVDLVACEDTRVTAKLLAIHGIRAKTIAYHDHNAERVRPLLIERLKHGESVALVADAGTPLVSDPGYKLVRAALADGIAVTALPGPSAVLTALVLSGLPTDRFLFAGFPPAKAEARRRLFAELATVPTALVFMESAQRLAATLADMAAALGPRDAAVARELTKMFEEVRRGSLPDLAAHYAQAGPPRGEITVVVAPPRAAAAPSANDVERRLVSALATASVRDAAEQVAAATGLKRRDVYARALRLAGRRQP